MMVDIIPEFSARLMTLIQNQPLIVRNQDISESNQSEDRTTVSTNGVSSKSFNKILSKYSLCDFLCLAFLDLLVLVVTKMRR